MKVCIIDEKEYCRTFFRMLHSPTFLFDLSICQVCIRLTEERMMLQKEEIAQMLVYGSSAAAQQMQSIVEGASTALEKMRLQSDLIDEQSITMWEQREESQRLHLDRKKEEQEMMIRFKQQVELLNEQSSNMRIQQLEAENREKEASKLFERMQATTTSLIAEQANTIKEQTRDMERMEEVSEFHLSLFE